MRTHKNIGALFAASALISAISRKHGVVIVTADDERVSTMPRMPNLAPRTLPEKEARSWLKSQITQADRDAIARAEAKRARKAAKLRRTGL